MNLRIVAGAYGGRQINTPHGHKTHPMSEKMRGALFNMLGDVTGLYILDAYSGSGALAFEALSRGAKMVIAVEKDNHAYETIVQNAQLLRIQTSSLKVTRANVASWLTNNKSLNFDIIFCDPPYDKINLSVLKQLADHLNPNGIIAFSLPPRQNVELDEKFIKIASKQYGDGTLVIFRRVR